MTTNERLHPYPWIVKTTAMVNHFYFYCLDDDFGPFFLKVCTEPTAHRRLPVQRQAVPQRTRVSQAATHEGEDRV